MKVDDPCFVFGLELDGEGAAVEITSGEKVSGPRWIHIDYSAGELSTFLNEFGVPARIVESLGRQDTRPRCIVSGNGVLLVLRAINMNPGADPEDMVSLRFWLANDVLITCRQRRLLSVQDVREDLVEGAGPTDLISVIIAVIGKVATRIADYVESVDENLAELEDTHLNSPDLNDRKTLSAIRREVAAVRRYLAPQRDALESLFNQVRSTMDERQVFNLREELDRMVRYLEDLDLIRERCQVVNEEMINRIAEQQNNRTYVLSIVAAVFLPISFVTGLFGMNVAGLPGLEAPAAFSWVAAGMVVTVVAILGIFKMKRWL